MLNYLILYTLHRPDLFRDELERCLTEFGAVRFVGHETAWLMRSHLLGQEIADLLQPFLVSTPDTLSVIPMHPSVEIYTANESAAYRDARYFDLLAAGHSSADAWTIANLDARLLAAKR